MGGRVGQSSVSPNRMEFKLNPTWGLWWGFWGYMYSLPPPP